MGERAEAAHESAAHEHHREGDGEQPVRDPLAQAEARDQTRGRIGKRGFGVHRQGSGWDTDT